MTCPRTENGQALCHVVDHPDRPSEAFCSTCQRRFQKDQSFLFWNPFPVLMAIAVVTFILAGSSRESLYQPSTAERNMAPRFVAPPISEAVDVIPNGQPIG
jgi:hypothetical protein